MKIKGHINNKKISLFLLILSLFVHKNNLAQTKLNDSIQVDFSYLEGPHIKYISANRVIAKYTSYNKDKDKFKFHYKFFRFKDESITIQNITKQDTNKYIIYKNEHPIKDSYENVDKIVTIGDIHGNYSELVDILRYNKIIDDKKNWIFGKSHLVITGDVFDRGDNVTECLWLIYKLEKQAFKMGGRVHFLLGNHELMIMTYDDRYISKKYKHHAALNKLYYSQLYEINTILGKWLRNKNTMVRINKFLFVHGGISPKFLEKAYSIKETNKKMTEIINDREQKIDSITVDLFLSSHGPLWYRGYLNKTPYYDKITEIDIDKTLEFYNVDKIIFGHTPVMRISPFFASKIVAVDVPIGHHGIKPQAMLITNKKFYRLFSDKEKQILRIKS
ncbi:MAG: metallophosphoesterase [Marinifilaceae bacterium]|nr:metallophosphoesterase [Marinifilaceae bacterium]